MATQKRIYKRAAKRDTYKKSYRKISQTDRSLYCDSSCSFNNNYCTYYLHDDAGEDERDINHEADGIAKQSDCFYDCQRDTASWCFCFHFWKYIFTSYLR